MDDKSNIDSFNDYQPPSTTESAAPVQEPTTESSIETPSTPTPLTTPTQSTTPTSPTIPTSPDPTGRIIASPYAKTVARERGVNLQVSQCD